MVLVKTKHYDTCKRRDAGVVESAIHRHSRECGSLVKLLDSRIRGKDNMF